MTPDKQSRKIMTTVGNVDTSDLIMIIRWIAHIFSRSLKLEPTSQYIRVMSYEHHGMSNYRQFHCLFNRLLRHILKTASKLRVTGLCVRGIHRWSADPPEKGSIKWQITPLHDVINLRRDFTGSRRSCSRCRVAWFRLISENIHNLEIVPDNKVHGANMGPIWVLSAPDGPHVGPVNLAIRD